MSGIGGYGNCIGIPTVAGETKFNDTYNENILVNAMAVGHAKKNKIFYSKAKGINKLIFLFHQSFVIGSGSVFKIKL